MIVCFTLVLNDAPGVDIDELRSASAGAVAPEHPKEMYLASEICLFQDLILQVLDKINETHRICDYLYNLCDAFSGFYTNCRVIEEGKPNTSRLLLCEATAMVMRQCFALLGIEALMKI